MTAALLPHISIFTDKDGFQQENVDQEYTHTASEITGRGNTTVVFI